MGHKDLLVTHTLIPAERLAFCRKVFDRECIAGEIDLNDLPRNITERSRNDFICSHGQPVGTLVTTRRGVNVNCRRFARKTSGSSRSDC
jgi:hypothetical protein